MIQAAEEPHRVSPGDNQKRERREERGEREEWSVTNVASEPSVVEDHVDVNHRVCDGSVWAAGRQEEAPP